MVAPIEPQGVTPEPEPVKGQETAKQDPPKLTLEDLQKQNEELQKQLNNKTEIADRLHKKNEKFEAEEKKRLEAQMSELERAQKERDEARALLGELQVKEQKRVIAEKIGLPLSFADRLKGATPEEMEADAKLLLEAMPKPKVQPIGTNAPAEGQAAGETLEQRRARIRGGAVDIFNPDITRQYGGGVITPTRNGKE